MAETTELNQATLEERFEVVLPSPGPAAEVAPLKDPKGFPKPLGSGLDDPVAQDGDDCLLLVVDQFEELFTLADHAHALVSIPPFAGGVDVACSPDGTRLAMAGEDGTAKVWDVGTGQALLTLFGHMLGLLDVMFSPGGRHLATSSQDGTVRLTALERHITLSSYRKRHPLRYPIHAARQRQGGTTSPGASQP
jgi:hypothetical protein